MDVRIDEDLIEWLDGYAAKRRWNRTQALTEILVMFKDQEEERVEANARAVSHS